MLYSNQPNLLLNYKDLEDREKYFIMFVLLLWVQFVQQEMEMVRTVFSSMNSSKERVVERKKRWREWNRKENSCRNSNVELRN